ncbi:NADH-quinone oxidoreductase subunit N [Longibacter salinarum]|uniref:NADH-quinone oxidoreductase subunit N n=1 Tax=Longibacter salinarum TaxID=1850348 RepID=A0A2A8D1X5_9BACT|nr:NADH-quinone oxidoreductase subunit N [Longibacter salinarum]PEN14891.1 NADH-quinone oxidoreductase subunit N [Longibacter salinarum]
MDLSQAFSTMAADLPAIFSMSLVTLASLVMILQESLSENDRPIPWIGVGALAIAAIWEVAHLGTPSGTAFFESIRTGGFASYINLIVLGSGIITIVLSVPYLDNIKHGYGEVYAMIMFATVGMLMLGTANSLVSIFVGLETMSVSLYVLTGLIREDEGSVESALKYFLLGAFSTGFFLYGIALMYGATGTMYLPEMQGAVPEGSIMFWAGVALFLIGFLFKVSAAPFHMWTPDVYQGAPTPLTGYMSTASKAAAFASLILVLFYALPDERWSLVLSAVAVITMIIGNVLAVAQDNVKRMLAYSSIAHAGYVLVALAAGTNEAYAGAMFYLLIYALMNLGAFGVMAMLEWDGKEGRVQSLNSLAGIGYEKPLLGVAMGVFMFSLTGFPPLGGFMGKYAAFAPAVDAGLTWLVLIAVLMSAISAYYYLRVVYVFWMQSASDTPEAQETPSSFALTSTPATTAIVVCAVALVVLGVYSGGLLDMTIGFFDSGMMAATP